MKLLQDIVYNEQGQKLDLWLPEGDFDTVFVFLHYGGLERGDKSKSDKYGPYLADRGIALVSANYRMYPDARYPDFLEDSADAVAWTKAHIGEYSPRCDRIFVGGSSAGGYLSMMLFFDDRWLGKHGIDPADLAGFIHNSGQPTAHFRVLEERGLHKHRLVVDESAPLYWVGARERYAPMLFIVSDEDMQNRYEQTMLTVSTLKHFGHEAPGVQLRVLQGKHCAQDWTRNESGNNIFGTIVADYIDSLRK